MVHLVPLAEQDQNGREPLTFFNNWVAKLAPNSFSE